MTEMYYGPEEDINTMQAFDLSAYNFNSSFSFYGFGPNETYYFMVVSGSASSDIVGGNSGSEDCGGFASSPDVAPVVRKGKSSKTKGPRVPAKLADRTPGDLISSLLPSVDDGGRTQAVHSHDDEDDHRHLMFKGNYGDDDENLTKITTTIRRTKHQND